MRADKANLHRSTDKYYQQHDPVMVTPNVENITAIPYIVHIGEKTLYIRVRIPYSAFY
jgi:hypothetical protein